MMLPVHGRSSLIIAYVAAILTLVLCTIDTVIQYYNRQKRSNYLPARALLLVVILFIDVGLISFIEVNRSEKGTRWVPAIWILIQFSMLLEMSLEAIFFLRICNSLNKDKRSQKLAYILIYSVISIVLIFIIPASALALAQSHNQTAIILQVLGCFSAHMFASLFPLWVLSRGGDLLLELRSRRSWGLLSCSSFSILAAGASLGLLGLPGLYPTFLGELIVMFVSLIPWTILQGYKLTKVDVGPESTESLGSDMRPIEDTTEPSIMEYELQVGPDGLVSKAEDLGECHKVVSWGPDPSTTL